jgi:alpha-tubulin suppressor-like RCC1 family protein
VQVTGLTSGVTAVTGGLFHTCAVTGGRAVQCWGLNTQGQLGNNTTTDSLVPVQVTGLTSGVTTIAAGADHTCAVRHGRAVWCWGYNVYGQLGNNTTTGSSVPVPVVRF